MENIPKLLSNENEAVQVCGWCHHELCDLRSSVALVRDRLYVPSSYQTGSFSLKDLLCAKHQNTGSISLMDLLCANQLLDCQSEGSLMCQAAIRDWIVSLKDLLCAKQPKTWFLFMYNGPLMCQAAIGLCSLKNLCAKQSDCLFKGSLSLAAVRTGSISLQRCWNLFEQVKFKDLKNNDSPN